MSLPVSFLSDYGLADEFVGVIHAVVARISPASPIIDITHAVPRGNVRAGALALVRAIQYLPEGVALAVVDPGVGTARRAIAASTPWGYLVGPDNGVLAPAVQMMGGADAIVSLENPEFHLPRQGVTFDGRDVFAPAAGVLASEQAGLDDLGPRLDPGSTVPLLLPLVESKGAMVAGEVLWIDGYGNAQTNITPDDLAAAGHAPGATLQLSVGTATYHLGWRSAYGEVESGEGLIHVDSYGQMAVAIREGRADEEFNLAEGSSVVISSPE